MSGAHERDRDPLSHRIRVRVGRRGCCLMFFALVDLIYAAGLACAPPQASRSDAYAFLSGILPLWAWALPWAFVGALCALYAFAAEDRVAFAAASALSVGWSVLNLSGWLLGEIPRGFLAGVVWGGYAAFIQVIAGWSEPVRER
ncbi:hypothetical protein ACQEVF_59575 [Nonomuraea polychroma]|uniref:hypothetical protein n=1 Tax=Nonomuraea polychroma TaxID=46176 RepID=UPI003D94B3DF